MHSPLLLQRCTLKCLSQNMLSFTYKFNSDLSQWDVSRTKTMHVRVGNSVAASSTCHQCCTRLILGASCRIFCAATPYTEPIRVLHLRALGCAYLRTFFTMQKILIPIPRTGMCQV